MSEAEKHEDKIIVYQRTIGSNNITYEIVPDTTESTSADVKNISGDSKDISDDDDDISDDYSSDEEDIDLLNKCIDDVNIVTFDQMCEYINSKIAEEDEKNKKIMRQTIKKVNKLVRENKKDVKIRKEELRQSNNDIEIITDMLYMGDYSNIGYSVIKMVIISLAVLIIFGSVSSVLTYIMLFFSEATYLETYTPWIIFKKFDDDEKRSVINNIKIKYDMNAEDIVKNNLVIDELVYNIRKRNKDYI